MLLIRIALTNVLFLLMILAAKVNCQLGQKFGSTYNQNPERDIVDVSPLIHKLSGRQPNRLNFDLAQYNLRNAPNPPPAPAPAPAPAQAAAQGPSDFKVKIGGNGAPDAGKPGPPSAPGPKMPKPVEAPLPSPDSSSLGKDGENSEKLHGLEKMVQELYVAQAQVQLEANEIQRAQAIAAAAQQALEEAANNVRMITAALHAAQQTVASAAIRAQTAQLQLAAHDQLLFAARQKVDALSAQIVSLQAEEGIQPTKMIVDLQSLLNKLKEPLPDNQKPTPVPSILGEGGAGKPEGKIIHSVPSDTDDEEMELMDFVKKRQGSSENNNNDDSIENLLARSNDLIHYSDSLLRENSEVPYENSNNKVSDDELKKDLIGLDENEIRSLVNFIVSLEHKQDSSSNKQSAEQYEKMSSSSDNFQNLDPKIFEKTSNQKYMNDFLEAIKNSMLKSEGDNLKSLDKDQKFHDYIESLGENMFKSRRAAQSSQASEDDMDPKEDSEDEPIFNVENAFYVDSENFRESQP